MAPAQLKKQISSTYATLMDKSIDGKVLQYWERAIQNDAATFESFVSSMVMLDDYKVLIKKKFSEALHEMMRSDTSFGNAEALFEEFWCGREEPARPVTVHDIVSFVARQAFFEKYFVAMVKEVYSFEKSREPTDDDIARLLNKARASEVPYTAGQLMKDIDVPGSDEAASSKEPVATRTSMNVQEPPSSAIDQENLDNFEDVFSRPMYVQEYFKYIVRRDTRDMTWSELHTYHSLNYNRLRTMFQNYTGKSISEYYFVKKYLIAADEPTFFDAIVESIVTSAEYRSGMQKVICERYQSMFDQSLETSDVEYIFKIIKSKKLDIVSDELNEMLSQLKEETDDIISNIFKVFKGALKRPPDMGEVEQFVPYFRERKDTMTSAHACGELERLLINTLEFHEIIKQRVRDIYFDKKNKEIIPSMLYTNLNKTLAHIETLTTSNLDEIITNILM